MKEIAIEELAWQKKKLAFLSQLQPNPPEGVLACKKQGSSVKWYQTVYEKGKSKSGKRRYISKKERSLAEALALKSYLARALRDTRAEIKALELYLTHCSKDSADVLLRNPFYIDLLKEKLHLDVAEEVEKWLCLPYERSAYHLENLVNKTSQGQPVRSKSEALIGSMLENQKVPYKYECKVNVAGKPLYPDFTVYDQRNHKEVIWEHFGMMDDKIYLENAIYKHELYLKAGYIPFKDIIFTYETKNYPLDTAWAANMIRYFFKPE